ncbi:MAG: DUF1015 domain-containing protein [Chloroflexi bacterium]|nr:DUF1015 domain-containing protein [Chloroflexota bacterium]
MVDFRPFRAVRYASAAGPPGDLICPPFDVISPEEARALEARNPHNMVKLELTEVPGEAPAARYDGAAAAFRAWQASGVLERDADPAYYLLRQRFAAGGRAWERAGIFGALGLEQPGTGVLVHEDTAPGVKEDRFALMRAAHANFSPLMMLYRDPSGRIAEVRRRAAEATPAVDFEAGGGEAYTLWPITDEDGVDAIAEALRSQPVYIADGHHRYETALAYERDLGGPPSAASRFVLTCLIDFDDPGLLIQPYYRVVHGLDDARLGELRALLKRYFSATPATVRGTTAAALDATVAEAARGQVALVVVDGSKRPALLKPTSADVPAPDARADAAEQARAVEAVILQEMLFRPVMGERVAEYVAYVHDGPQALEMVASGEGQIAFFIKGVPAQAFEAIVGAGIRLPRKSTFFHPKLPSGLVINPLEGDL